MRTRFSTCALLVLIGCSSGCFEDNRRTERVLAQAIARFHEQLNDEHYHDIYSQADAELRSRLSEADFTVQLSSAHGQLGKATNKPFVFIKDSLWRSLRRAFGPVRELIPDGELVASDTVVGDERFVWAVENDQAKLVSYDFRFLCKKPCAIGFGP